MRPQLPTLRADSTPAERAALGASGVLDELDLLIADLRGVGLDAQADRVEVARAIVWRACGAVVARAEVWRDDLTQDIEAIR